MNRKRLLKHLIFWMFFIFIANTLGEVFYWQYTIWYFDMPIHFLGGFWVGMFFLYFFSFTFLEIFKQISTITKVVFSIFVIGVLWEIFEFVVFNHMGHTPFIWLDTISDVCFDLAGGLFALLYFLPASLQGGYEVKSE